MTKMNLMAHMNGQPNEDTMFPLNIFYDIVRTWHVFRMFVRLEPTNKGGYLLLWNYLFIVCMFVFP